VSRKIDGDEDQVEVETPRTGPPLGVDPVAFYERGAAELAAHAVGVEALAYRLFGPQVLTSVALAIDPIHKFRLANAKVSGITRTRTFTAQGTPAARSHKRKNVSHDCVRLLITSTPDPTDRYPTSCTDTTDADDTIVHGAQQTISGYIKDTTERTREHGVDFGEFQLWKPEVHSRPRSRVWIDSSFEGYAVAGGNQDYASNLDTYYREGVGPAARITSAAADAIKLAEETNATNMIAKHALGMVRSSLPLSREFSATREIGELKDLPKLLQEGLLRMISRDIRRVAKRKRILSSGAKTTLLANSYLESVFGWLPMYRAVLSMLRAPEHITKRVNRLLSSSGIPTTWSSTRKWIEPYASTPGFTYDLFTNEAQASLGHTASREVEMRCVVNTTVEFPPLSVPELRDGLVTKLWGLDPHPEDVYNLIPWSWLVDWFTGLGDYVAAYDMINRDKQIINYAFMTYDSTVTRTSQFEGRVSRSFSVSNTPPLVITSWNDFQFQNHTSRFVGKYTKRVSLANGYGVKPSWDLGMFSDAQLAILTALSYMRR